MASIVIVEDEYIVALDIKRHVEKFGHTVPVMFASGEELIEKVGDLNADLVLIDIKLQGEMDGVDAATILNEKYSIPVILLTAYADDDTIARAKITQPFGYIIKPFEERELKTAIEIALYRASMERQLKERDFLLRQAQKMEAIGRLAGGVAHDFNNIITAIMGYANLLVDEANGSSEAREDIEGIRKASIKAANLTKQLLAFSRHQVLKPRVVDVKNLIQDMERMIRRLISEDISMGIFMEPDSPCVFIDGTQLEQVILNLVVNARDAMEGGGSLQINGKAKTIGPEQKTAYEAIPPGEYLEISVRDSGSGIKPELLPKIFEPFFTTKEKDRGTGLGLSTVYGIIKQSNGYIDIKSEPGKGSVFKIFLPAVLEKETLNFTARAEPAAKGGKETILIVEDEDDLSRLVTRLLVHAGYHVLTAINSGEALLISESEKGPIDLLLTDVVLPYLPGDQLAERMQLQRPGLKILLSSGYPDRCPPEGSPLANHFIQKPFTKDELLAKVRMVLDEASA